MIVALYSFNADVPCEMYIEHTRPNNLISKRCYIKNQCESCS